MFYNKDSFSSEGIFALHKMLYYWIPSNKFVMNLLLIFCFRNEDNKLYSRKSE